MELGVDHSLVTGSSDLITIWDSATLRNYRLKDSVKYKRLCEVIDMMGAFSKKAQGINSSLTSVSRLMENPSYRLYLMCEGTKCLGILKIGRKKLFIRTPSNYENIKGRGQGGSSSDFLYTTSSNSSSGIGGKLVEMEPLCALDFYIHESQQRFGNGRRLYDFMISSENIEDPALLAIDRPSPKFLNFMAKHFGLKDYVPQSNNFVVFNKYFEVKKNSSSMTTGEGRFGNNGNRNVGYGGGGNNNISTGSSSSISGGSISSSSSTGSVINSGSYPYNSNNNYVNQMEFSGVGHGRRKSGNMSNKSTINIFGKDFNSYGYGYSGRNATNDKTNNNNHNNYGNNANGQPITYQTNSEIGNYTNSNILGGTEVNNFGMFSDNRSIMGNVPSSVNINNNNNATNINNNNIYNINNNRYSGRSQEDSMLPRPTAQLRQQVGGQFMSLPIQNLPQAKRGMNKYHNSDEITTKVGSNDENIYCYGDNNVYKGNNNIDSGNINENEDRFSSEGPIEGYSHFGKDITGKENLLTGLFSQGNINRINNNNNFITGNDEKSPEKKKITVLNNNIETYSATKIMGVNDSLGVNENKSCDSNFKKDVIDKKAIGAKNKWTIPSSISGYKSQLSVNNSNKALSPLSSSPSPPRQSLPMPTPPVIISTPFGVDNKLSETNRERVV